MQVRLASFQPCRTAETAFNQGECFASDVRTEDGYSSAALPDWRTSAGRKTRLLASVRLHLQIACLDRESTRLTFVEYVIRCSNNSRKGQMFDWMRSLLTVLPAKRQNEPL